MTDKDNIKSLCPFCDKVYEWKRGLTKHLVNHHVEKQALKHSATEKNTLPGAEI